MILLNQSYENTETEITINKVDDSTVSLALKHGTSCKYDIGFSSVKMNSASSFTLNEVNFIKFCNKKISGTGTYTNNNISIFAVVVSDNTAMSCCADSIVNVTISASK